MAIQTISNPPTADDWTRIAADAQHVDHYVNDATPASLALPGGGTRDNLAKVDADAKARFYALNMRGAWATGTAYAVHDLYTDGGVTYLVLVAHTSTTVSADLAAGDVGVYQAVTLADIGASDGATKVGYGGRTVASKLGDSVSILDYAGAGDWNGTTGTDNGASIVSLVTDAGNYMRVRFPYIKGSTNVYYFAGTSWIGYFAHSVIDADPGVSFVMQNDSILYDTEGAKTIFVRPVQCRMLNLSYDVTFGTDNRFDVSKKAQFLSEGDFDRPEITSIATNTSEIEQEVVGWNLGDIFTTETIASTPDANTVSYSSVPNDGNFHCALRRCAPGDEISFNVESLTSSGEPTIVAMLRSTDGYGGVYFTTAADGLNTQIFFKNLGVTGVNTEISWIGKSTHESYIGYRSYITIRIVSYTAFEVLFNGCLIARGTLPGFIYKAGAAVYGFASVSLSFKNWTIIRNRAWQTGDLVNLLILGDSKTASRTDCWPDYARKLIEGSGGLRVTSLNNYAIAGQDSAGQLANLTSLGVPTTPYLPNICVIDVGTNDQQGSLPTSDLINNIAAMVAFVQAANAECKFLIANYSIWYTRDQCDGTHGQASANYQIGAPYRGAIARYCAENGFGYIDLPATESFVVSQFSGFQTPDLKSIGDVLQDNIHPSQYGAALRGWAYARAICGMFVRKKSSLEIATTVIDVADYDNSWTQFSTEPLRYRMDKSGFVHLRGVINTGTTTDGTTVVALPAHLQPEDLNVRGIMYSDTGLKARFELDQQCQIKIYAKDAGSTTYFFCDSFPAYKINNGRP